MKLIPALIPSLGALLLAAGTFPAHGAPVDEARAAAATQYLADGATMNAQAALSRAIPRSPVSDTCPGGAEQALRHQIETMVAGQPDYDAMAPKVAAQWRTELDRSIPATRQWGVLVSLKQYPRTWGATYEAQFEHARVQWKIACRSTYGKITGISFKTLS